MHQIWPTQNAAGRGIHFRCALGEITNLPSLTSAENKEKSLRRRNSICVLRLGLDISLLIVWLFWWPASHAHGRSAVRRGEHPPINFHRDARDTFVKFIDRRGERIARLVSCVGTRPSGDDLKGRARWASKLGQKIAVEWAFRRLISFSLGLWSSARVSVQPRLIRRRKLARKRVSESRAVLECGSQLTGEWNVKFCFSLLVPRREIGFVLSSRFHLLFHFTCGSVAFSTARGTRVCMVFGSLAASKSAKKSQVEERDCGMKSSFGMS